jgi:hypothetical protein
MPVKQAEKVDTSTVKYRNSITTNAKKKFKEKQYTIFTHQ